MSSLALHPARSPEFLSRLHDGDLTAAERAQFESHRAHCAECRRAAAEFESALALFRSSHARPPASDLAARILRRLQAGNTRRRPFGVTFGIDLRWAGAFAAALLAVLIGSTVVMRRESAERRLAREGAPIPVVMERERRADESAKNERRLSQAQAPSERRVADMPPRSQSEERNGAVPGFAGSPATKEPAAAPPPAPPKGAVLDKENKTRQEAENRAPADRLQQAKPQASAAPATEKSDAAASSFSRAQERLGGEGAQYQSKDAGEVAALRLRLEIFPMDGAGTAPQIVGGTEVDLPADLRGREFTLVVEPGGRVREVRAVEGKLRKKIAREEAVRDQLAVSDEKTPQALRELRFQPGDRARILRVRIE